MIQSLIYIIAFLVLTSEAQSCVDTVDVRQKGDDAASTDTQVIIPRSSFSCNGRVTGYLISLESVGNSGGYPSVQVWHPTSSTEYTRVDTECALTASDISMMRDGDGDDYYLGNVSCTGNNRIEFHSGDIIGYHHGSEVRYRLWNIGNNQYRSYRRTGRSNPLNSFNINNADDNLNEQPLIQVMYDIRCDNLSAPAKGEITSCTSGRVGVGYEGDTCSFTCNTGYELTGSGTRICQSDGNWNGTNTVCRRDIQCDNLSTPANGEITSCSSGRVGVGYEGDTCSFTCNTGYELTGSDTRTCQSNGSWSGSDDVCRRVTCSSLTDPNNGMISCSLGDDGVPSYEDTCSFTCNTGYELTGSDTRTCQNDGSWSGAVTTCTVDSSVFSTTMTSVMSTTMISVMSATMISVISTTVTSVMPTTVTLVVPTTTVSHSRITTTITSLMSTLVIPSNITDSEDFSSNVAGVVVGCVVGVVVFIIIIVLAIFLVLYKRRKSKDKDTQGSAYYVNSKLEKAADDKRFGCDYHQYSVVKDEIPREPEMTTIKDNVVADYEAIENSDDYCTNDEKPIEAVPYIYPTIVKGYSKASSGDYEVCPAINQVNHQTSYHYEEPATCAFADSMVAEELHDDEQIYEDPGHNKEKIYIWFEKKKFQKLENSSIKILKELGSGEFGTVHLGLWSNGSTDPVQVAVKTLNSQCSESDRVKFLREAAIMGQFVHNNVIKLHGVVTEEENVMIVLEYMPKGDLREFLIKLKALTGDRNELKNDLMSYCRQIAAGMSYLANKQFVHRDLAARNILVSSDDVCKIADFGMARDVSDDTYYITCGGKIPVKWTAPEALLYRKYSPQTDVWSFGCVMYEIWSLGHKPFEDFSGKEYMEQITTGYRLPPPPGCPRAIYELMIQCWHPTARDRSTSGSISQTLQKSDRALLTSSIQVTDDDVTRDNQPMMLGAPLTAGSQLYLDLQQRYTIK